MYKMCGWRAVGADYRQGVMLMSDQPQGCTGELCKEDGTYVSEAGGRQFFAGGETFGPCPVTGQETRWQRAT